MTLRTTVAVAALSVLATRAMAQTAKVGFINAYSGPFTAVGEQLDRGIRVYMRERAKDLPPGIKLDLIRRDDTGPNPEVPKRLARELITCEHAQMPMGLLRAAQGSGTPRLKASRWPKSYCARRPDLLRRGIASEIARTLVAIWRDPRLSPS